MHGHNYSTNGVRPSPKTSKRELVRSSYFDIVDLMCVRDPWAANRVSFRLDGPGKILAVGNGDPRGLEPFTVVSSHPLYFGKAVAVVRRNKGATGPIRLTASVEGLAPATVEFP